MNPEPAPRADRRDQVAAVIALVSFGAAIVVVAVNTVSHWRGLAITLSGLLVIVVGAWYVVSRRGATRYVATVAVVAGAGMLVAGFVVTVVSAPRILTVVVLASVSIG